MQKKKQYAHGSITEQELLFYFINLYILLDRIFFFLDCDFYFRPLEEKTATVTGKNTEEQSNMVSNTKCTSCSINSIFSCNFCVSSPPLYPR